MCSFLTVHVALSLGAFLAVCTLPAARAGSSATIVALNDDGAWNWLQDERAIVANSTLIVGSVAMGHRDPERAGDIEVAVCDLTTGRKRQKGSGFNV